MELHASELGEFAIDFDVTIPVSDYQSRPKLEFDVPNAVRNELSLVTSDDLTLVSRNGFHRVGERYYFAPTNRVQLEFEHPRTTQSGNMDQEGRLTEVDIPETVMEAVNFSVSFTEDGSVLTAMVLTLPPRDDAQLILKPVAESEVWSLHVNGKPRTLYESREGLWIIPLDENMDSRVEIAYLTETTPLALEGRLDFTLPETGLTAQRVDVIVGLPERIALLAMDSPLQAVGGLHKAGPKMFSSFSGEPHHFSAPFYRGQSIVSSMMYHEPVNP